MAKKEMGAKITEMRDQLIQALDSHFQQEITRSLNHMDETIAPYTRFVRAEQEKNLAAKNTLEGIKTELTRLQASIDDLAE
jgi:hypothetical protein